MILVFCWSPTKINWRICCYCFFCLKVLGGMGCKLMYFSNNSRQEPCCLNVSFRLKWPVLLGQILWDIFLAGCSHTSNMKAFAGLRRISWIICHLIEGDSWSSKTLNHIDKKNHDPTKNTGSLLVLGSVQDVQVFLEAWVFLDDNASGNPRPMVPRASNKLHPVET